MYVSLFSTRLGIEKSLIEQSKKNRTLLLNFKAMTSHLPNTLSLFIFTSLLCLRIRASKLGGSYVDEELTVDLARGTRLNLHMAKKADREFTVKLVSLVRDIRGAVEMHKDLAGRMTNQAELIKGCFVGIKALEEQYGPDGVAQQGMELFQMMLGMISDSLQGAYQGQIVGVILFNGVSLPESEAMLNVKFTSRTSRLLEENAPTASPTLIVEILLVRRTLAWITGIILLISTLLGMFFLFNMPITRDTLLYSNVKLD